MIRKIGMMVLLVMMFSATAAFAAKTKAYVSLNGGVTMPTDSTVTDFTGDSADVSYKNGYNVGGAFGVFTNVGFRPEVELNYRSADTDLFKYRGQSAPIKSDISAFSVMTNVFYDIKTGTAVSPYLGGGLGFASVDVANGNATNGNLVWFGAHHTVFAYQAGVGILFKASDHIALDVGYRYFGTDEFKFDYLKTDFKSHNMQLGVQYRF